MTDQTTALTSLQLDEIEGRAAALYESATVTDDEGQAEADQLTGTDVPALLAYVRALRSEQDELRGKFADAAASLAEQVLRYGRRQREHNADREELEQLRTALTQIRHLHKDSPMGPCPVCIDADAAAAGGDGLVPYPCPTGRLAGAQDCDPPHVRAARPAEACGKCRRPFDPADTRFDGHARHRETPYCRSCIDLCHDATDAFHRCVICDTYETGA